MPESNYFPEKDKPINASVKAYISSDGMEARLCVEPPENGGSAVTMRQIEEALKSAGVVSGIDMPLLEKITNSPEYSRNYIVAHGIRPVEGTDGTIRYLFDFTPAEAHPKVREDNTVDYRDLGLIETVRAGQALCAITPPVPGTPGKTVTGVRVPAGGGRAVPSPQGKNTVFNEDRSELIAEVSGQVQLLNSQINVFETFVVSDNVGPSTGNIKFIGNVQVNGNIQEGFVVESGKSITISGNIEGACIKAEGDITIRGGVVGMGRSVVQCKGNIHSSFFENCEVAAGRSIQTEAVMHSTIKCGENLELTGSRAKLIGGRCLVGGDLTANTIGSPAGLPTELRLGADPDRIARRSAILKEFAQEDVQQKKLDQIISLLGKYEAAGRLTDQKKKMLEDSRVSLERLGEQRQSLRKEFEDLSEEMENAGKGKVVCRDIIYRGVTLTIGLDTLKIEVPMTSTCFSSVNGKIVAGAVTY